MSLQESVVPVVPLADLDATDPKTYELICQAKESDLIDSQLTIGQALSKYKIACFWAMFLSTSLIMEGYDSVVVSIVLIRL